MKYLLAILAVLLPVWSTWGQTNGSMISAVAVLTIHVSDTNVHQSVFQFLTDVLKLPVEYGPEQLGQRRYAAVYAGNMFIEPCGPFSNMEYPVKEFKALFFGLNCRSDKSSSSMAKDLERLNISYEQVSPDTIRVRNEILGGGVYLAISTKPQSKSDEDQELTFQNTMKANHRAGLGLEYVKEIWLGYTEPVHLQLWNEFLGASGKVEDQTWSLNNHQRIRLVKSGAKGVVGIVWKVRSLDTAESYLKRTRCYGRSINGRIELDKNRTDGLTMYLSAE